MTPRDPDDGGVDRENFEASDVVELQEFPAGTQKEIGTPVASRPFFTFDREGKHTVLALLFSRPVSLLSLGLSELVPDRNSSERASRYLKELTTTQASKIIGSHSQVLWVVSPGMPPQVAPTPSADPVLLDQDTPLETH